MLFIFDENFPPEFVRGFSILEKANKKSPINIEVVFAVDFMGKRGSTDQEIIAKATQMDAVIITHDKDFKTIKSYKPLLIEHRVGYVHFRVPKGKYTYWDIVKAFVNRWEELKTRTAESPHPFAFEIHKDGGIQQLSF